MKDVNGVEHRYKRIKASIILKHTMINDEDHFTDRSVYSLTSEWQLHNIGSALAIVNKELTEHTRDADLDAVFSDNAWYTQLGTVILAILGVH